jgi:integrase
MDETIERERIDFGNAKLCVSQRESIRGKPWRAVLSYYVTTGYDDSGNPIRARRQVSKSFPASEIATERQAKIAANKWLRQLQADQDAAERRVVEAKAAEQEAERIEAERAEQEARVKVASYVDGFLNGYRGKRGEIEGSTLKTYRASAKHIRAEFADVALVDLTPKMVDAWLVKLSASYSQSVQSKAYRLLNLVCRYAVRDGDLLSNPCDRVTPPPAYKPNPNALTKTSRDTLISELKRLRPTAVRTAAIIALFMGLRRGEVCGLHWADVDLRRKTMFVHSSIGIGAGGGYVKTPKTQQSTRRLPMPDVVVDALKERRMYMRSQLHDLGGDLTEDQFGAYYVIGNVSGGYLSPTTLGKQWSVIAENLGLIGTKGRLCSFHDLRHDFATTAIANNADVKSVQAYLGHASAAMTLDTYADADEGAKRELAHRMNATSEPQPREGGEVIHLATGTGR